jgi:hypothetical protein
MDDLEGQLADQASAGYKREVRSGACLPPLALGLSKGVNQLCERGPSS